MTGLLLRVLVVDDEEPARQRLVDLLRRDMASARTSLRRSDFAIVRAICVTSSTWVSRVR